MNVLASGRPAFGKGRVGWPENPVRLDDRTRGRRCGFPRGVFKSGGCGPHAMPCAPVLRRRVDSHQQPVIPRPVFKRQKSPCFSSSWSAMGSMIDSRKVHVFDPAVESQPGRSTTNTGSRSGPNRALSCPFLPLEKGGPGDEESPFLPPSLPRVLASILDQFSGVRPRNHIIGQVKEQRIVL